MALALAKLGQGLAEGVLQPRLIRLQQELERLASQRQFQQRQQIAEESFNRQRQFSMDQLALQLGLPPGSSPEQIAQAQQAQRQQDLARQNIPLIAQLAQLGQQGVSIPGSAQQFEQAGIDPSTISGINQQAFDAENRERMDQIREDQLFQAQLEREQTGLEADRARIDLIKAQTEELQRTAGPETSFGRSPTDAAQFIGGLSPVGAEAFLETTEDLTPLDQQLLRLQKHGLLLNDTRQMNPNQELLDAQRFLRMIREEAFDDLGLNEDIPLLPEQQQQLQQRMNQIVEERKGSIAERYSENTIGMVFGPNMIEDVAMGLDPQVGPVPGSVEQGQEVPPEARTENQVTNSLESVRNSIQSGVDPEEAFQREIQNINRVHSLLESSGINVKQVTDRLREEMARVQEEQQREEDVQAGRLIDPTTGAPLGFGQGFSRPQAGLTDVQSQRIQGLLELLDNLLQPQRREQGVFEGRNR